MAQKILTSAVVGLGNIGMGYDLAHQKDFVQTHTKAYLQHGGYQLSFGVDPDVQKRKDFNRLTGSPAYASLEEAVRHVPSVDVVSVCAPNEARANLWKPLSRLGSRVVVLEKPLAKNLKDAGRVLAWARANKVELCVNYLRRFDRSTQAIKTMFERRTYGKVVGVDIRYNGGFYNNASHYIDMMLALFGEPLRVAHDQKLRRGKDHDVDFKMVYPGFVVHGRSVGVDCPVGELTFWCEGAEVLYRKFGQEITVLKPKPDPVFRKFNELAPMGRIESRLAYSMGEMIGHVYGVCCGKRKLISDGQSAWETLLICERILSNR